MLILAINTAQRNSSVHLIFFRQTPCYSAEKTYAEHISWKSDKNESEKLLPSIEKILNKNKKTWKNLTHILVVTGPGGFTALRVGIATANAISYGLNIPIAEITLFDLWEARIKKKLPIIHQITKRECLIKTHKSIKLVKLDKIKKLKEKYTGELADKILDKNTISEKEGLLKIIPKLKFKTDKIIEPFYCKSPGITRKYSIT